MDSQKLEVVKRLGVLEQLAKSLAEEAAHIPEKCNNQVVARYGLWCANHRGCREYGGRGFPTEGGGYRHPGNCLMSWGHGYLQDDVAGIKSCGSTRLSIVKQHLSKATTTLNEISSGQLLESIGKGLEPALVYTSVAKRLGHTREDLLSVGSTLEQRCNNRVEFVHFEDVIRQHDVSHGRFSHCNVSAAQKVSCDKVYREVAQRISRVSEGMENIAKTLAKIAEDHAGRVRIQVKAAIRIQAQLRGFLVRKQEAKNLTTPNASTVLAKDAPCRRPTRRGGMWKKQNRAHTFDIVSIPDTDDGFEDHATARSLSMSRTGF